MDQGPSDNERILGFVEDCRDAHIAPYPVGLRVLREHTGLSMYRVRTGVDQLLSEGRLRCRPTPTTAWCCRDRPSVLSANCKAGERVVFVSPDMDITPVPLCRVLLVSDLDEYYRRA